MNYENIRTRDPEIYESMMRELRRQRDHIELIASENFASPAVRAACGSIILGGGAVQFVDGFAARILVQRVDIFGNDGGKFALALPLGKHAMGHVGLDVLR